jgi:hypothetical protein
MNGRRSSRAVVAGLTIASAYVAGAILTTQIGNPFERAPLLDGFTAPAPYRWVRPPPALAAGNQKPDSAIEKTGMTTTGSTAFVPGTQDAQVTVVMPPNAAPPAPGQLSLQVSIEPLAGGAAGPPPAGFVITGNVYRITAAYLPSRQAVTNLQHPAQLNLFYPAEPNGDIFQHVLLASADGKTWTRDPSVDLSGQQMVEADAVSQFGYFAAARSKGSVGKPPPAHRFPWVTVIFLSLAAVIAVATILGEVRSRRVKGPRSTRGRAGQDRPPPKGTGKGGGPPGRPRR